MFPCDPVKLEQYIDRLQAVLEETTDPIRRANAASILVRLVDRLSEIRRAAPNDNSSR